MVEALCIVRVATVPRQISTDTAEGIVGVFCSEVYHVMLDLKIFVDRYDLLVRAVVVGMLFREVLTKRKEPIKE